VKVMKAKIGGISVDGPLASGVIRRAVERELPALAACYRKGTAGATVKVTFTIGETRRAGAVAASGDKALIDCVTGAIQKVRAEQAPDVGEARVSLDVAYVPESS
jgi:hypothetical protein